ncbi:putative clathrin assembly protein At4g40080 [Cicer arietinum]|uniref:Clathrin assembly protein At4g40080 n=1 Tax=Cicer arietinum TaxID=3827 RepID=A0A1S2YB30_CICAR|nr:putative clathrin assembly protein At4g40080 [Cicer arietinum]
MGQQKKLKTLTQILKDKASVLAASLSIKRHVSSLQINVLRATTHTLSSPPSDSKITAVLSTNQTRACINSLMDRLHKTKSATVAMKCLFTLHNIVFKGPFTLKDQLSSYPSYGGHNFLNLSNFKDHSDFESTQLSSWVRWYATVLEQILTVSRILGYYLHSNSTKKDSLILGFSNADLLYKIEALVVFVEQISFVPESLHLQKNELVYEVVRMVGEDYRNVQSEILLRLEELGQRMETEDKFLDVGELNELLSYLRRLEESKEKLVLLFVNRRKNNGFWELIKEIKMKGLKKKEEIERKWITVVVNSNAVELTRSTNPFLEPGQCCPILPLSFATVR